MLYNTYIYWRFKKKKTVRGRWARENKRLFHCKKKRKYNLVVDEFGKRKFETDPDCSGLTHRDIVSP